jgi:polyisoprenoid-binding protein YceI
MKKLIPFLLIGLIACGETPEAEEAIVQEPESASAQPAEDQGEQPIAVETFGRNSFKLPIDPEQCLVKWIGTSVTGNHSGNIKVKSGEIEVRDSVLVKATVVFDMSSIRPEGMGPSMRAKLIGDLKSANFFDVANHPTATFSLKTYEVLPRSDLLNMDTTIYLISPNHYVTGDMEIRGVTKSMTFPAHLFISPRGVQARGVINVDRTLWGIDYKADKTFGQEQIHPLFNIDFTFTYDALTAPEGYGEL